jgi:Raf kinase inhibitor-like YbhB/YbcL family protein
MRKTMSKGRRWGFGLLLLVLLIVAICAGWLVFWRSRNAKDIVDASTVPSLTVTSSSFVDGGMIPPKLTCDGGDVSPQLSVSTLPAGTRTLAWLVNDPDSPVDFVHWIIFNLPAGLSDLPEGASAQPANLQGGVQGSNDFDKTGYGGPCPPGRKPHHYFFRAYALDTALQLHEGATRTDVAQAAKGHVLAEGKIVGLYTRGK